MNGIKTECSGYDNPMGRRFIVVREWEDCFIGLESQTKYCLNAEEIFEFLAGELEDLSIEATKAYVDLSLEFNEEKEVGLHKFDLAFNNYSQRVFVFVLEK